MLPKTKYRIVPDSYLGYEVQIKQWWLPFWYQCDFANTHISMEQAKKFIENHKSPTMYEE